MAFSTPTMMMIPRAISHQSMAASPLYCKGRKAVAEVLNDISKFLLVEWNKNCKIIVPISFIYGIHTNCSRNLVE
jgi:hypothetical protein